MTNWRPITSAPKDGRELTVRQLIVQGTAIWRPDIGDWIDPATGERIPEPTHWKATGRGHPE